MGVGLWLWVFAAMSVTASLAATFAGRLLDGGPHADWANSLPTVKTICETISVVLFVGGLFDLVRVGADESTVWLASVLVVGGGVVMAAFAVLVSALSASRKRRRSPEHAHGHGVHAARDTSDNLGTCDTCDTCGARRLTMFTVSRTTDVKVRVCRCTLCGRERSLHPVTTSFHRVERVESLT